MNEVYRIDAHGKTVADAALDFASNYWDKPRKVQNLRSTRQGTFFEVKDGMATYQVKHVPAVHLVTVATYRIYRH